MKFLAPLFLLLSVSSSFGIDTNSTDQPYGTVSTEGRNQLPLKRPTTGPVQRPATLPLPAPLPTTAPSIPSTTTPLPRSSEATPSTTTETTGQYFGNSADSRSVSTGTFLVGYEFLSSWVPSKKTVSYTQIINRDWSVAAEYGFSSIGAPFFLPDVGGITEKRYSFLAHYYLGNSFNFIFGGYHNKFDTEFGQGILKNSSNQNFNVIGVKGIGVTGGISNRWQYSNGITLGIDWFRMNLPLFDRVVDAKALEFIQNEDSRDQVQNVINKLRNIPTFVLLGINVGYTF